jgi:periplasmic divalent cation tolerance protein
MKTLFLISTTVEQKEDAERIAALLLERRLVACAQISAPITSIYRWQGQVTTATEFILSLKTTSQCVARVKEVLTREHPYQIPEIIGQEIVHVNDAYSAWVDKEVS